MSGPIAETDITPSMSGPIAELGITPSIRGKIAGTGITPKQKKILALRHMNLGVSVKH